MKSTRLTLLYFFSLFSILNASAQKVKVDWGSPEMQPLKSSAITGVIGSDLSGYFLVKQKFGGFFTSSKTFIERFNFQHDLEFSTEVDFENKKIKEDLAQEGIYLTSENILVFGSDYDRKTDRNTLYACVFDFKGKKISDWKTVDEIYSKKKNNSGNFTIQVSDNRDRLFILHNEPYQKNENERFNYLVIDPDLNTVWEKKVTIPLKDKDFSISNYKIDSADNIVMLARITKPGKAVKGVPDYTYKILQYDYKKDDMTESVISLGKLFISEITFRLAPGNKIIASGFYSKKEGDFISGAFFMRINRKTMETEVSGHKEFPKDFLNVYLSDRKIKKGKEVYGYDLDHLVLKDDGGAILVAEQYYVQVVTTTTTSANGFTTTRTTYYYYYRDIIAVDINPDASIEWIKRIPKYQYSVNDGGYYSSYIFAVNGSKMYFLFNDNIKNFSKKKSNSEKIYVMNRPKKAVVNLTTINANGEMESEILFSAKNDARKIIRPKMFYQYDDEHVLIYSEYKKNYKMGTVVLPD